MPCGRSSRYGSRISTHVPAEISRSVRKTLACLGHLGKGAPHMGKMQRYLAEALGTFTLVGIGSFAIVSAGGAAEPAGVLEIAFGFGLALLVGLYAFGEISGGHFKPAVSLGLYLERRLPADDLTGFWCAPVR